jgi:hypothetical protein
MVVAPLLGGAEVVSMPPLLPGGADVPVLGATSGA